MKNALFDPEADRLCNVKRHGRMQTRRDTRGRNCAFNFEARDWIVGVVPRNMNTV